MAWVFLVMVIYAPKERGRTVMIIAIPSIQHRIFGLPSPPTSINNFKSRAVGKIRTDLLRSVQT